MKMNNKILILAVFFSFSFLLTSCNKDETPEVKDKNDKDNTELKNNFELSKASSVDDQKSEIEISKDTIILKNYKFVSDTLYLKLKDDSKYSIAKNEDIKKSSVAKKWIKWVKIPIKKFDLKKVGNRYVYKYKYKIQVKHNDGSVVEFFCKVKVTYKSKKQKFFIIFDVDYKYDCINVGIKSPLAHVVYSMELIDKSTGKRVGDVYETKIRKFREYISYYGKRFCDKLDKGKTYTLKVTAKEYDTYEKNNVLETHTEEVDVSIPANPKPMTLDQLTDISSFYSKGSRCIYVNMKPKTYNIAYKVSLLDNNGNTIAGGVDETKIYNQLPFHNVVKKEFCSLEYGKHYKVKVVVNKYSSPDKKKLLDTKQKVLDVSVPKKDDILFSDIMAVGASYLITKKYGKVIAFDFRYKSPYLDYEVSLLDDNAKQIYSYSTKGKQYLPRQIMTTSGLIKVPLENKTYKVELKVEKYATKDKKKVEATKSKSFYVEAKKMEFYESIGSFSAYIENKDCLYVNIFDRYSYQKIEVQLIDKSSKAIVEKYSYEGKPSTFWQNQRSKTINFCGLKKGKKYDIKVIASKPYQDPTAKATIEEIVKEISLK